MENKKPCLHLGKQGLEKFYGSSVTCLPPVYPNSFRGLALCTTWIGQGLTHNPGLAGYDVSLSRPTLSAKSCLICSCRSSSNGADVYSTDKVTSNIFTTLLATEWANADRSCRLNSNSAANRRSWWAMRDSNPIISMSAAALVI